MTAPPAGRPSPHPVADRPGVGEKAAFFGGSAGTFLVNAAQSFAPRYLTVGLGLSATSVGTMLLVTRILDGLIDPLIGLGVDHLPGTRWGRFRPYILIGSGFAALALVAFFTVPALASRPLLAAWIVYPVMGAALSMVAIPLVSLMPAISEDARTRSQLSGILGFTFLVASAAATAATLPVVTRLGGGERGWGVYGIGMAIVGVLLTVLLVTGVRERVTPVSDHHYSLTEFRRVFFSDRAVPILLGCKLAVQSASGVLVAAGPFFFPYYMGNQDLLSLAAGVMVVPTGASAIGLPALARRHGIKPYYILSLATAAVGLGSIAFVPKDVTIIMVMMVLAGIGFGGVVSLNFLMLAELTDYIEWRHGYRAEATLAAMASFAVKAGAGVGAALVSYVIGWGGFDGNREVQTAGAVHAVLLSMSVIPAGIGIIGALMFLAYPVTRSVAQQAHLAVSARRAAALQG